MTEAMERLRTLGFLQLASRDVPGCGDRAGGVPEHELLEHNSVWAYINPSARYPYAAGEAGKPVFTLYGRDSSLTGLRAETQVFVLFGAVDSPQLRTLRRSGAILVVIEPNFSKLEAFVQEFDLGPKEKNTVFFLGGDPKELRKSAFENIFTKTLFSAGYPVILLQKDCYATYFESYYDIMVSIEILYFRYAIYPLAGHDLVRSKPIRDVRKGLYYDQQKHVFENYRYYLTSQGIDVLKDKFSGETAILVAAGPSLDEKIEFIRSNVGKTIIICVNNALKTLYQHGIIPDIVVIIDSSVLVEESFQGIPELPDTIMVAHQYATVGNGVFKRICFYGACLDTVFPKTPYLAWHGSVITVAFSLARYMGCTTVVFVGAQLASDDPYSLRYSRHSIHGQKNRDREKQELVHGYPQLYPVTTAQGEQIFTTLNFLDVALWLRLEIERSSMEVVNTARNSLLFGEGIRMDPEPGIKPAGDIRARLHEIDCTRPCKRPDRAVAYIEEIIASCREVRKAARAAAQKSGLDRQALDLFETFEQTNVSYLVQRFRDFSNHAFHKQFFILTDPEVRWIALKNYFEHVAAMMGEFVSILSQSLQRIKSL